LRSLFFTYVRDHENAHSPTKGIGPAPHPTTHGLQSNAVPALTFSELALYAKCPYGYRLASELSFATPISRDLGYGKSIHHILRRVAESVKSSGKIPDRKKLDRLFETEFHMPFESSIGHIHNVSTSSREEVSVRKSEVDNALKDAVRWANEIVAGHFPPRPDAEICASCDYIPLRSVSPDDKFDEGAAGLSSDEEIDAPVRLLRLDFRLAGGGVARAAEVGEKQSVDCKLATVPRLVLLRHLPYFARGFYKFQSANVWHVACSPNAQQN